MSGPDDSRDELVDSLLGADGRPCGNGRLRGAVFAQTIGVIRFRRRLKKCALAGSLLGCYLAGMMTMGLWRPTSGGRPQPSTEHVAANLEPSPLPGPVGIADKQIAAEKMTCAEVLRRSADRHLLDSGDVKRAVRNYKTFLELSSAEQRAISPTQDNWLLMALKDARSKEMKHDRIEQN